MNPPFALFIGIFIGIDRSDTHLDFCLRGPDHSPAHSGQVSTDPAALHPWFEALRACAAAGPIAVAFEQPAPNLVLFFSQFSDVVVFPLNPAAVRSYCRSFAVSNAHSDASDAARIAEYVHLHHAELRARVAASPAMRRLQALVEHRRSLVDERTGLLNRTLALLKLYYPQAIALLSVDRWRPMDCEFLLRWPSLQALQSARPAFHTIMRMLAFKWIRILMRAWHNHTPYDESQYTQALILRGSPICAYLGE